MKVFASLIPLVLLLMSYSCESDPAEEVVVCPELPLETPCSGEVPCLEYFHTIQVQLSNPTGEAVKLDSFQSKNLVSAEAYLWENWPEPSAGAAGFYPVLSDSELNTISRQGTPIQFTGFIDGAEVVKRVFIIGHDCCHVGLLSGITEITLSIP